MRIITIPIEKADVWDKNPRSIKKKDYERLKTQIQRLGKYKPLIAYEEKGRFIVIGGNMRLRAFRELGIKEIELSIIKPKSEAEKLEYAMSDNDRAGEYDDQALAELLYKEKDAIQIDAYRIDMGATISVDHLLTSFGPKLESTEEDQVPEPQATPIAETGDVYELGPHRLVCGDSTKPWAYEAALAGRKADLVVTDPPYNVDYKSEKLGKIMGDDMGDEEFMEFTLAFFQRIRETLKRGGAFYICSGYSSFPIFRWAIHKTGMTFSTVIVWVKNQATMGWQDYHHRYEMVLKGSAGAKRAVPVVYGWNNGRHYFQADKFEADVWEMNRRAGTTLLHPTQKPLALLQRAIKNSSRPKELVLDPFAGSGATIIAAEREGRQAAAIELDPKFVDVIIRRYAAQGGQTEAEIRATRRRSQAAGAPGTLEGKRAKGKKK